MIQIRDKLKAAQDRQKSYADKRRKPFKFKIGDKVMLKVSPWKGVLRCGKKGKLSPRYIGQFKIIKCVSSVSYKIKLLEELSEIHDVFYILNLKKCLAEESLAMPHHDVQIDEKLRFIEKHLSIKDR
ncbi:uncharacterized protein LOC110919164 [Helianthus annuus]|uniref:uncharacterized protein LOC110919164 n=1 Tax=Helianthus annuus TaxID=4232 RepID=UPI000B8FBECD|nr:uncharacterized protein LOC110919164 [Helianthus annuus]